MGDERKLGAMHNYDYSEFLSAKRKESRKFKPTGDQIETAMSRIKGVFRKYHGWIDASGQKELVGFLARSVFNRNRDLGDYKRGELSQTLTAAVRRLVSQSTIRFDEESCSFGLMERIPDVRRHRQKYPARGRRRAA